MAAKTYALPPAVADAAKAYHTHHFGCPMCKAAGIQRTPNRCDDGTQLHDAYTAAFATLPPLPPWVPRAKKP